MEQKDALITDPNDELYSLQKKYNIKINRSSSSDAIYIFRTSGGFKVRVGHYIYGDKHIKNFAVNVVENHPRKEFVEKVIKKYLNRF